MQVEQIASSSSALLSKCQDNNNEYEMPPMLKIVWDQLTDKWKGDEVVPIPLENSILGKKANLFIFKEDIAQLCTMVEIGSNAIKIYFR